MVASVLKMAGPDWMVPDDTTLCRRQKALAVQIPYRRANGPLNLLVDTEPWCRHWSEAHGEGESGKGNGAIMPQAGIAQQRP